MSNTSTTEYHGNQKTKGSVLGEDGFSFAFKDSSDNVITLMEVRVIDADSGLANVKLKQGSAIESPAYDSAGLETNGYIPIMWLDDSNKINFGAELNVSDELTVPDNPGFIKFLNYIMNYEATAGEIHGISFDVNFETILGVLAESDGAGGYNWKGILQSGYRFINENSKEIIPGTWRERIEGADLIYEKYTGALGGWVEIFRHYVPPMAPYANNFAISGDVANGSVLSSSYEYYDIKNIAEDTPTYQWYIADDDAGTNEAPISGANSDTYTTQVGDIGSYIRLGLIVNNTDNNPAAEIFSGYIGAIT